MCIAKILKVKKVYGKKAVMSDGREVLLGVVDQVKIGDYLEVYANLVVAKKEDDVQRN